MLIRINVYNLIIFVDREYLAEKLAQILTIQCPLYLSYQVCFLLQFKLPTTNK